MLRFEWDPAKAASNRRKHRVRFDEAMLVFADPDALVAEDRGSEEIRWRMLGRSGMAVVLLVVYTTREEDGDEIVRIISARKATAKERERYGETRAKDFFF